LRVSVISGRASERARNWLPVRISAAGKADVLGRLQPHAALGCEKLVLPAAF